MANLIPIVISIIVSLLLVFLSLLFVVKILLGITLAKYIKTIESDEVTTVFVTVMLFMMFLVYFIVCAATYNTFIK